MSPPTAQNSFYITGGTLQSDARCYVERQADRDLYAHLLEGEFCYVLTSRQMGKSSLMNRTAERLRAAGIAVARLDLQGAGQHVTPEQGYLGLLLRLGWHLKLEDELEDYWDAHGQLAPMPRWMGAPREAGRPHVGIRPQASG